MNRIMRTRHGQVVISIGIGLILTVLAIWLTGLTTIPAVMAGPWARPVLAPFPDLPIPPPPGVVR